MKIPYIKAHGAQNDFLLTWKDQILLPINDMAAAARVICDRHTGAGADGWLLVADAPASDLPLDAAISLWNSDGSTSEMSGNGTRCAAAMLIDQERPGVLNPRIYEIGDSLRILTGAGVKQLRLLERFGHAFFFEMNMGRAAIEDLGTTLQGVDATILNTGNPQCAVFVENFNFDWRNLGATLERDPRFPNRTNVSFIRVVDEHTLEVRFFERGAGETMSSGTGTTGAGAAAVARGLAKSPVEVLTPAGPLKLRWESDDILLTGPAEIIATGEFYFEE